MTEFLTNHFQIEAVVSLTATYSTLSIPKGSPRIESFNCIPSNIPCLFCLFDGISKNGVCVCVCVL